MSSIDPNRRMEDIVLSNIDSNRIMGQVSREAFSTSAIDTDGLPSLQSIQAMTEKGIKEVLASLPKDNQTPLQFLAKVCVAAQEIGFHTTAGKLLFYKTVRLYAEEIGVKPQEENDKFLKDLVSSLSKRASGYMEGKEKNLRDFTEEAKKAVNAFNVGPIFEKATKRSDTELKETSAAQAPANALHSRAKPLSEEDALSSISNAVLSPQTKGISRRPEIDDKIIQDLIFHNLFLYFGEYSADGYSEDKPAKNQALKKFITDIQQVHAAKQLTKSQRTEALEKEDEFRRKRIFDNLQKLSTPPGSTSLRNEWLYGKIPQIIDQYSQLCFTGTEQERQGSQAHFRYFVEGLIRIIKTTKTDNTATCRKAITLLENVSSDIGEIYQNLITTEDQHLLEGLKKQLF